MLTSVQLGGQMNTDNIFKISQYEEDMDLLHL